MPIPGANPRRVQAAGQREAWDTGGQAEPGRAGSHPLPVLCPRKMSRTFLVSRGFQGQNLSFLVKEAHAIHERPLSLLTVPAPCASEKKGTAWGRPDHCFADKTRGWTPWLWRVYWKAMARGSPPPEGVTSHPPQPPQPEEEPRLSHFTPSPYNLQGLSHKEMLGSTAFGKLPWISLYNNNQLLLLYVYATIVRW